MSEAEDRVVQIHCLCDEKDFHSYQERNSPPGRPSISSIVGTTEESECSRRTYALTCSRSSLRSTSESESAALMAFAMFSSLISLTKRRSSITPAMLGSEETTMQPAA